jgi:hypothetical protein
MPKVKARRNNVWWWKLSLGMALMLEGPPSGGRAFVVLYRGRPQPLLANTSTGIRGSVRTAHTITILGLVNSEVVTSRTVLTLLTTTDKG